MQFVTCTAPHHCSNNLQFDSRDNNDYMTGFLSGGMETPGAWDPPLLVFASRATAQINE